LIEPLEILPVTNIFLSDSLLFYILDGSILRGIKKNLRKKLRILRNAFKILILTAEDTK